MARGQTFQLCRRDRDEMREEALEFAGIGLCRYRFDGTVIFMDRWALRVLGLEEKYPDPASVTGLDIESLFTRTGRTPRLRDEVCKREKVHGYEYNIRTLTGEDRWVLANGYLVKDEKTGEKAVQVVMQDITDRRRAEQALRLAQFSLDHMSITGLWIGPDARFLYVNEAACRSLGYSREELLSMKVHDIGPNFPPEVWPGHWQDLRNRGSFSFDSRHRAKDGREFPVEVTVNYVVFEGKEYNLAFARDMTERQRAEKALRESEEKYRTLVENSLQGITILRDGRIVFANRAIAEITGYTVEELKALAPEGVNALVHPEDRPLIVERMGDRLAGKPIPSRYELRTIRKEGTVSWVDVYSDRIEFGDRPAILTTMVDITERKRAEEDLLKSEREKASILDSLSELVSYQDRELRVVWANRAAGESVGVRPDQLVGRHCHEIWAGRSEPCAGCPVQRTLETGEPQQGEVVTPDGRVWFLRGYPVRDESNGVVGAVEVTLDITEQKRMEEQLATTQALLRAAIEQTPAGIIVADAPDLNIRLANSAALAIRGDASLPLTDIPVELHPQNWQAFTPEGRLYRPEDLPLTQAILHGKTSRNVEVVIRREDGERRWVLANAAPVRNAREEIVAGVVVFSDITERKRAQEALRMSEQQYRMTLDSMGDAIHVVDRDLCFVLFNTVFRKWNEELGLDTDILGRTVPEVFPFLPEKVVDEYRLVMETGKMLVTEEHTEIGGRSFVTETRKIPVFEDGGVARVVTVLRDITERKQADEERHRLESQIQHAQKLESLGVLAGGIAHDFNNLLMGVLGNADLALMSLSPASPARENILGIVTSAKRAADLCKQMLGYSGRGRFVVQPLTLNELVKEMAHLLEVSISKRVDLRYDFEKDLPAIEADATQIRQIVLNLITNASEAIGENGGAISVSTGVVDCKRQDLLETYLDDELPEGEYVYFEVADTGCGIEPEMMGRIFDPFFTTKFTGRGLGLAAVLGIVRGHRGALKVRSTPGEGTTFRVLFPRSPRTARAIEEQETPEGRFGGGGTILVIDDEETVRSVTRGMLEKSDFAVLTASDGKEGLEVFRRNSDKIAAVILDLAMPRMDGDEADRELRRIKPDVRVILSSGYSEQEIARRFEGREIAGFIQKPYQTSTLVRKVEEAILR